MQGNRLDTHKWLWQAGLKCLPADASLHRRIIQPDQVVRPGQVDLVAHKRLWQAGLKCPR
jgi:hypothetical protein